MEARGVIGLAGCCDPCDFSRSLVLLAAAAAMEIAGGHTEKELAYMAAFFTTLGDNLAIMALCAPEEETTA